MQESDNESNSSEGFFVPELSVLKNQQQQLLIANSDDGSLLSANSLVDYQRPTDLLPRVIRTAGQYNIYPPYLNSREVSAGEQQLVPIPTQKYKQKRFPSLKEKYYKKDQFKCVYSKLHQNSEYNGNQHDIQDYNPDDYIPPTQQPTLGKSPSKFDSRFQSGNLLYAYQTMNKTIEQYDLIMQNDTNTIGYNQWFYFSFQNQSSKVVRFNIVNFIKKRLMFIDGVKPVALSAKDQHQGWITVGKNISYRKSFITRTLHNGNDSPSLKNYYTLSFDVEFKNTQDKYFIAMNYPYTYSNMVQFINQTIQNAPPYVQMSKHIICHTISNNPILCLRIKHRNNAQKAKIVCLARQHPGQSVGSFVLESFIKDIAVNQPVLKDYEIIVIPMVNPDGVIYGNFRTNLAGFDLNRQWVNPNRWLHPQIFFLKRFISSLDNITFCIDFHGHSKKLNSFIYACVDECISEFRVYPYMLGEQCQIFSTKDCTYTLTPDKFRTARINIFNEIKKPYVYTLETSFFGYTQNKKNYRFNHNHFQKIGSAAANCLSTLLTNQQQMKTILQQVTDKSYLFQQWAAQIKDNIDSQSNPSEDELTTTERKTKVMSDLVLKKKSKSKRRKKNKSKKNFNLLLKKSSTKLSQKIIIGKNDKTIQELKLEEELQITKLKKTQPNRIQKEKEKTQSNVVILSKPKIAKPQFIQKTKPIKNLSEIKDEIKKDLNKISKNRNSNWRKPQPQEPKEERKSHSNLLQANGYIKFKQEKKKIMQDQRKLSQAQYYLSVMSPASIKFSSKALLGQQIEYQSIKKQKGRIRQKIYVIKEHKVINSITRVNDQQIKDQLQREIQNRTTTLKNCQKIMNGLTNPMDKEKIIKENSKIDHVQATYDAFKNRTFLKPIQAKKRLQARNSERIDRGGIFFYNL